MGSRRSGGVVGIIKGLLNDMIDKLEAEEEAKASENAYCVKELGESKANKKGVVDGSG